MKLLNRPVPKGCSDILSAEMELDTNCEKPSKQKMRKDTKLLKYHKVNGSDDVTTEARKANINTSTKPMHKLYSRLWERNARKLEKRILCEAARDRKSAGVWNGIFSGEIFNSYSGKMPLLRNKLMVF